MTAQQQRLTDVERMVRACRPLALRFFRSKGLKVERKSDQSPVTMADRLIEEQLRRSLERAFPGERIIGEEFGSSGAEAQETYWTIDPIDGTRAFSSGLPSWGILVGRVERGRPVLGVCDYPVVDTTLGVAPGVLAYERTRGRLMRLPRPRPAPPLGTAVIFHGGVRWWQSTPYAKGFSRLVHDCFLERAYGDCYGYLWLLRGYADAVIEYGVKLWDLVPFAALTQATGRLMIDFSGQPNFHGPQLVAGHPTFARLVARILRQRHC